MDTTYLLFAVYYFFMLSKFIEPFKIKKLALNGASF
ncbi:hypothetical protein B879_00095 [Cecembia lonarensis LW9]|uniref:Uncharacterized protein n=1 Tax=Cecembia lonarensis (strain CCUG 58316 / KCTC 22772 / LW9) TaxID=1225176 RepID=K1L9L0_CECL9|nr:hypothetical protein B879_00095 [Cecembia lonarensis LW9]